MTAKIEILKIARLEYDEAKVFYEIRTAGFRTSFEDEIKILPSSAFNNISQAWPSERKEIRRYILHKFP